MNQTPVFIIDDDAAMRDSLLTLLRGEGLRARAFASPTDFLDALPDTRTACVVSDLRMPGMDGLELVSRVKAQKGDAWSVIVMTGHGDVPLAVQLMKTGIADFIEKPFAPDKMIEAIKATIAALKAREKEWTELEDVKSRMGTLTPRESQVFTALIGGKSNKEIALDLEISPRTIEIFRAKVMNKMGADSLSSLVRMGLTVGVH